MKTFYCKFDQRTAGYADGKGKNTQTDAFGRGGLSLSYIKRIQADSRMSRQTGKADHQSLKHRMIRLGVCYKKYRIWRCD